MSSKGSLVVRAGGRSSGNRSQNDSSAAGTGGMAGARSDPGLGPAGGVASVGGPPSSTVAAAGVLGLGPCPPFGPPRALGVRVDFDAAPALTGVVFLAVAV